jgi:hypothetical protein
MQDLDKQAEVFSNYIVGEPPKPGAISLFKKRVGKYTPTGGSLDAKLLDFISSSTWSVAFVDAGLALIKPQSEVRKRIFIMFAILETDPDYSNVFLPKSHGPFYLITAGFIGLRAAFRSVAGLLIVNLVRLS